MNAVLTLCREDPGEARDHDEEGAPLAGRYELLERIGQGTLGSVYRARDHGASFPRDVCIKRIAKRGSAEHARALRDEARLLAQIHHRNVVTLLAIGQERCGAPFLALELVDGMDLRALVRARESEDGRGSLPTPVAVHVACAVLHALAAVERTAPGLVHRDVTPHNVLLSRAGEVKLADFGIALPPDLARDAVPTSALGKPGYMAPEQLRGEAIDSRADLFAVGVILCELLTRRRPWRASRLQGMDELRAIASGAFLSMRTLAPDLERPLATAIDHLLAPNARDRFPSAIVALRALAPFSAGELGPLRLGSIVAQTPLIAAPTPADHADMDLHDPIMDPRKSE